MGVWLPLALADIVAWLVAGATMGERTVTRGEALEAWMLPELARAVRNGEAEAEAAETVENFENLMKRFGAK
jgi:hypothetical protein